MKPFIEVVDENYRGTKIIRVGWWTLYKDIETGEGEWQWFGKYPEAEGPVVFELGREGSTDLSASGILDKHTLREGGKSS